jgi:hypothetical protein
MIRHDLTNWITVEGKSLAELEIKWKHAKDEKLDRKTLNDERKYERECKKNHRTITDA